MANAGTTQDWAGAAEQRVLDEALRLAASEGWTRRMARLAGRAAGLSEGETELLIPHGPADLAALLADRHDARALSMLQDVDPASLKIREAIRAGVEARLDAAAQDEPSTRRWLAWLALPPNAPLAAKLAWRSADVLWRWAGDAATDENHYSKRLLLAGILSGGLALRMHASRADALAFVDRRIEDVMRFERLKATTPVRPYDLMAGAVRALGRARYGRPQPPPDLTDVP
ncbi:MAG TPA: COQ9 family protein [Phenylobacterium sp.]|uniref:COQ9 family protein n=1 Tax=Phenylobacterium sp. TaxID=1871053 RepID=UPI002BD85AA1|nr:COQ9 family protein [Phenylobacterium sp.]HSV02593.1 COQ9 family protein [Phenylobacterium sp.]